jgi:hypothetical protein
MVPTSLRPIGSQGGLAKAYHHMALLQTRWLVTGQGWRGADKKARREHRASHTRGRMLRKQDELRMLTALRSRSHRSHNPGKRGKFLAAPSGEIRKERPGAFHTGPVIQGISRWQDKLRTGGRRSLPHRSHNHSKR